MYIDECINRLKKLANEIYEIYESIDKRREIVLYVIGALEKLYGLQLAKEVAVEKEIDFSTVAQVLIINAIHQYISDKRIYKKENIEELKNACEYMEEITDNEIEEAIKTIKRDIIKHVRWMLGLI